MANGWVEAAISAMPNSRAVRGERAAQQSELAPRRGDVLADRRADLDLGLQHLVGDALAQALPAAFHEALGRGGDQIVAGGIDQQVLLLEAKTEGWCGEWHGRGRSARGKGLRRTPSLRPVLAGRQERCAVRCSKYGRWIFHQGNDDPWRVERTVS